MKNAWTEEIDRLREVNKGLLEACKGAKATIENVQGEWLSVTETFAPEWTHPLKRAVEEIDTAIVQAERGVVK